MALISPHVENHAELLDKRRPLRNNFWMNNDHSRPTICGDQNPPIFDEQSQLPPSPYNLMLVVAR